MGIGTYVFVKRWESERGWLIGEMILFWTTEQNGDRTERARLISSGRIDF